MHEFLHWASRLFIVLYILSSTLISLVELVILFWQSRRHTDISLNQLLSDAKSSPVSTTERSLLSFRLMMFHHRFKNKNRFLYPLAFINRVDLGSSRIVFNCEAQIYFYFKVLERLLKGQRRPGLI